MNSNQLVVEKLNPERYVVKVAGGFAVMPHELSFVRQFNVGKLTGYPGPTLDQKGTLDAVRHLDIALVTDSVEWKVRWMRGAHLTTEDLDRIY